MYSLNLQSDSDRAEVACLSSDSQAPKSSSFSTHFICSSHKSTQSTTCQISKVSVLLLLCREGPIKAPLARYLAKTLPPQSTSPRSESPEGKNNRHRYLKTVTITYCCTRCLKISHEMPHQYSGTRSTLWKYLNIDVTHNISHRWNGQFFKLNRRLIRNNFWRHEAEVESTIVDNVRSSENIKRQISCHRRKLS